MTTARWQPVDPSLEAVAGKGWSGARNGIDLALPQRGLGILGAGRSISAVTASRGRCAGLGRYRADTYAAGDQDAIVYDDVFDRVDLSLEPVPGGVKESLVLADRDTPRTFDFDLRTGGLTPRLDRGSVGAGRRRRCHASRDPAPGS